MMKRRTVCLCLVFVLLLPMLLTGCGADIEKTTLAFDDNYGSVRAESGLIASNDSYDLLWDDDAQCALLYDKIYDKWYSTTPYDYYNAMPDNSYADNKMYSPINVSYVKTNPDTNVSNIDSAEAFEDSIEMGGVSSELIENGVRINYAFPELRFSVSLELTLTDKGLEARIPMDRIQEEDYLIYEIEVLPYLTSAINGEDSYLMVPSGGGALIEAKERLAIQKYDEAVYGNDVADFESMAKKLTNQIHLPVFGARDANGGMLGVLEQGAACGRIKATSGDPDIGFEADGTNVSYSTAYASFRVRGHEYVAVGGNTNSNNATVQNTYSESIADYDYLSVQYYPLGDDTTYVGMADTYRQHLQDRGYLQTHSEDAPALSVSFLGATQTPQSFFGIPYDADEATTSLTRTQEITQELNELVGQSGLLVTLQGYGKGGLSDTVIGGGFKLSSSVGSTKDWKNLVEYSANNNVVMALDYETVRFQDGSSGFKVGSSAAYLPSQLDAEIATYVLNTAVEDEDGTYWYLLSRGKLAAAVEKAINSAKKMNAGAISFESMSSMAYSDYRDGSYTAKAHMEEDVAALLAQAAESGLKVVSTKANDYAALNADYIIETPTRSSQYSCLSQEIPFYALVFQGYKNLTSPSINTAINVRETYLKAVATGQTLQFTLCDTQHDSLQFEDNTAYISSVYSYWKDDITAMVQESAEIHEKVGNQAIVQYTIEDGMSTTVFEDGTTVYVNYTDEDMNCPMGTVPALGFVYG